MQNGKEDSAGFVSTIKEKVRDWEIQLLWIERFFEYLLLLGLVSFVIVLIFRQFNLIHTKATSARYMLSALVQSQAAIIAIVITLTLIAVQLTASAYSPRVIRIFRDNPDMWILLGFYGLSIFYGLLVLKMIRGAEDTSQIVISNISLEAYISYVYALGISTFVSLFLYLRNIMNLLEPENIIKRLAIDITKDNFLNSKEDPVQPIMDIVHGSIMKYDIETTRIGLKVVTEKVVKIIDSDRQVEISSHFRHHLERVGRSAVSKLDEESAIVVIGSLDSFGKSTAKKGLENATGRAVVSLGEVGRAAAENGLGDATWQVAWSLGEVGRAAAENGLEDATWGAAEFLEAVGKIATEKNLVSAAFEVIMSLESVGQIAAEKGLETATEQVVKSLLAVRQIAEKVVASNLTELTLSSEEIVKTAIQKYESELKEQDSASFKKFKKIYEQKLEKRRAEK